MHYLNPFTCFNQPRPNKVIPTNKESLSQSITKKNQTNYRLRCFNFSKEIEETKLYWQNKVSYVESLNQIPQYEVIDWKKKDKELKISLQNDTDTRTLTLDKTRQKSTPLINATSKRNVANDFLDQGSTSRYRKAIDSQTGTLFALRIFSTDLDHPLCQLQQLIIDTLKMQSVSLDENHAIPMLCDDNYVNKPILHFTKIKNKYDIDSYQRHYILYNFANGTLKNFKSNSMSETLDIAKHLMLGLQHLHDNLIVHRDIKPSNILYFKSDNETTFKYTNFDLSYLFTNKTDTLRISDIRGTIGYIAPEIIFTQLIVQNFNFDDLAKTDCWSLGVVLLKLFTADYNFEVLYTPVHHLDTMEQYYDITDLLIEVNIAHHPNLSTCQKHIVTGLTKSDPNQRMTLVQALEIIENA